METKTVKQKLVCFVLVNKVLVWIALWDRSNCRNYHWEPLVRCCGKGGSLTAAAHRWMWRGTSHRAFPTQPWGFASQEIHIHAESWPGTEAVQLRWWPCTGLRGPGALISCCHCWPPCLAPGKLELQAHNGCRGSGYLTHKQVRNNHKVIWLLHQPPEEKSQPTAKTEQVTTE